MNDRSLPPQGDLTGRDWLWALDVECPTCDADAGRHCTGPKGHRVRVPHYHRRRTAEGT